MIGRIPLESLVPGDLLADEKKGPLTSAISLAVTLTSSRRSPSRTRWVLPVLAALFLAALTPAQAKAQEPAPTIPDPTIADPTIPDPTVVEPAPPAPVDPAAGDPTGGTTDTTEPPPDQPPPPPPVDPSPHVRVLLAHFSIFDARFFLTMDQAALTEARAASVAADAAVVQAEQDLAAAQADLATAERELRDFSVAMFVHADGGMSTGTEIDQFGVFAQRKTEQLTDSVLDYRVAKIETAEHRVTDAAAALDQQREIAAQAAAVVTEREGLVADSEQWLSDSEQELRTAQARDALVPFERDPDDEGEFKDESSKPNRDMRLVRRETGSNDQWELTLEGASVFTPEELAAWFAEFQIVPTRSRAPAADLARWFVEEGAAEGFRGDVAFAQAILETGSFTNLDTVNHNNYAGIGHCDSCPSGWNFATPQDGVRAQIQLLKSYVYEQPEYKNPLVDRRLRGPAGCCQTWNELSGVWASAGGYSAHIMRIYQDMLEWLYVRRLGVPPPPRPG